MTHAYVRTLVHNCITVKGKYVHVCNTFHANQLLLHTCLICTTHHKTTMWTKAACGTFMPYGSHPHKSIRMLQTESPRSINDLRSIWLWSDKVQPYMYHKVLKHFESHYSVWNKELCTSALRLKFLPLSRLKHVSKLFSLSRFHSILYHCNIPSCNKLTVTIATYIRTYVHTCNTSSGS